MATPFASDLTADARVFWDWAGLIRERGPGSAWPFFLGPLYAYALAGLRALTADRISLILHAQAALDAASAVLLADAARRVSRPAIGLGVGLVFAFCRMSVFFSGLLLGETVLLLLESLLICLVASRRGLPSIAFSAGVGALIGLLALGRPTALLLGLPMGLRIAGPPRGRWARIGTLVALPALIVAPAVLHDLRLTGRWMPITYSGGLNRYIGNNPHASGGWVPVIDPPLLDRPSDNEAGKSLDGRRDLERLTGRVVGPAESSKLWAARAAEFRTREPDTFWKLTFRKLKMMWNHREYPQIENRDVYDRVAGPLGLPIVGDFAFLGALGIAGALFAWSAGPAARFALGYVAVLSAGTAIFFVTDRFRIHLIPGVSVLAAVAAERGFRAAKAGTAQAWIRIALALACGVIVVLMPAPHFSSARRSWGIASDIGLRWMRAHQPERAVPYLREAARFERLDAGTRRSLVTTLGERADLHYSLGRALLATNERAEALRWLELAHEELPADTAIARALESARP